MNSPEPIEAWRKALISAESTLQEAIRNLNDSSLQIVLVAAPDGSLIGTLTDGDIRRGLLRGLDLTSPIDSIIQRNPLVAPPQLGRDIVLQLMKANKVRQLPIVDGNRVIVGLHSWDALLIPARLPNLMVIMAGGRAITFIEPSIYDEALALLARRGFAIPREKLERDFAEPYVADADVREAWRQVYRDAETHWDLYELAEKLVDLEYRFHLWRFSHMKTVERIIGAKAGTGGTSGVSYLKKALELRFYPELWDVRGEI